MNGRQMQNLNAAICDAFRDPATLGRAIYFATGTHLDSIAGPAALDHRVFEVIRWAESRGQTATLVTGLRKENPGNALLRAFADEYLGTTSTPAPSTPTPTTPEMTMSDLTTRTIHAAHAQGVVHLIRETLTNLPVELAGTVRAHLFADDATYHELRDLSEEGARAAIADALADENRERRAQGKPPIVIPATRSTALVLAVRVVTPARRACARCGRLDLAPVASRWEPATGDYCRANVDGTICEGLFTSVAFEPDVRAWTDGRDYAPGTTHDDARLPITDAAIRQWLATKGGEVHPYLSRGLTATQGALDLPALCAHLVATRLVTSPLAALNALAKPLDANLCHDAASAEVLCRKALESRGRTTATVETGATAVVVKAPAQGTAEWRTTLRKTLAGLYASVTDVRRVCVDAGVNTGRVSLDGVAENMWFSVITEATNAGRLDAIVAVALQEYPRNPTLLALRG